MLRVLALDFDGVICDSQREVFLVGLRTYATFFPHSTLVRGLGVQPRSPDPAATSTFQTFSDLTPLGNRAEDFGVALRAIEGGARITDQGAYDAFRGSLDRKWLEEFHVRFYQQRAALREGDLVGWLGLHAPYPAFTALLERIADRIQLAIATAKDGGSVLLLLERFGIDALFTPNLVLDKDIGVHKTEHLRILATRLGVNFANITFVDDKVNHLRRVAELGVHPVLAGWGYNTEREHELARGLGIRVATLDDAEQVLLAEEGP
jgi:phosphoglycolate phosphatase-like HAD superfamily hydrolase